MNSDAFFAIAATGFSVAFFHAALPTHWLPFVLTARAQKWDKSKTLLITIAAGCGHVLFTAVLGFLVAWCGIALSDRIGGWFPWIAGGALLAFGLYYIRQQFRGQGHEHVHVLGEHGHDHGGHSHHHEDHDADNRHDHHDHHQREHSDEAPPIPPRRGDLAAIASLLALLTFSPCEGFLPIYVSGVSYGWSGFFLLTLILSVATVAGMVVFTWLTLAGIEHVNLKFIEKYERGIMGGLLCLLGALVILLEH